MPFLVDWWDERLYHEREGRAIARQEELFSPALLAMGNRPRNIQNLQVLHDRVLSLLGVKP